MPKLRSLTPDWARRLSSASSIAACPSDRNMTHFGPAGAVARVSRATRIALLNAVPAPLPPSDFGSYRPMWPRVTLRAAVSMRGAASPPVKPGGRNVAVPCGSRSAAAASSAKATTPACSPEVGTRLRLRAVAPAISQSSTSPRLPSELRSSSAPTDPLPEQSEWVGAAVESVVS
jgi:hypothetical protein